uniref:Putative conserved secreted protein n=1 Tax=Ixodes ricinus TaxID=34613 RepID=A0A131XN99_IXORI
MRFIVLLLVAVMVTTCGHSLEPSTLIIEDQADTSSWQHRIGCQLVKLGKRLMGIGFYATDDNTEATQSAELTELKLRQLCEGFRRSASKTPKIKEENKETNSGYGEKDDYGHWKAPRF